MTEELGFFTHNLNHYGKRRHWENLGWNWISVIKFTWSENRNQTCMRAHCCAAAKVWLTLDSDWLILLDCHVNHLNLSSWLARFDILPYMSIFLQPTPFKFRGENRLRPQSVLRALSQLSVKGECGFSKQYGDNPTFIRFCGCGSAAQHCKCTVYVINLNCTRILRN